MSDHYPCTCTRAGCHLGCVWCANHHGDPCPAARRTSCLAGALIGVGYALAILGAWILLWALYLWSNR